MATMKLVNINLIISQLILVVEIGKREVIHWAISSDILIKRIPLKTMSDNKNTVKLSTTKNNFIEYCQQGNIILQLLITPQDRKEGRNWRSYDVSIDTCTI